MSTFRRTGAVFAAAAATGFALLAVPPGAALGDNTAGVPAGARPATAHLTVQKGGVRTGSQSVAGLAGAVYDFFAGTSAAPPGPGSTPAGTCTTGADGRCGVDVAPRDDGNQGYWIRERTAPSGYSVISALDTGTSTSTSPQPYNQLFTGNVEAGSDETFPQAQTRNTPTARGAYWADVRQNPPMPGRCGLKIALLMDTSESIAPALPNAKLAANGFVDALVGTPSQVAVYDFAESGHQILPPTSVPDADAANTVKNAINSLTAGGPTNWDQGLFQIAASSTHFDSVIMLTDGNPTVYGPTPVGGNGSNVRFREVENGIFSANAVKSKGTKVIAVGVGPGMTGARDNLRAISGGVSGDDFIQTDWAHVASVFHGLATVGCNGTVNVIKEVIPPNGTTAQAVPTGGWTFSTTTAGVTPTHGQTASGSGAVSFDVALGGASSKSVALAETPQAGFALVQNAGHNATCTSGGRPVTSTDVPNGFQVNALADGVVTCTVFNQASVAPGSQASVVVDKTWKINGHTYPDPTQPADFQSALQLTGQQAPAFGQTYGGYRAGGKVTVGEVVNQGLLPAGCGTVHASGDLGNQRLRSGLNEFHVTNTVQCQTTLQLIKTVINPFGKPIPPTEWTLKAFKPGAHKPVFSGVTGITRNIDPGVTYSLGESKVAGYDQEIAPGAHIVPPATGTWHCVLKHRDGSTSPEFAGVNGTVAVQVGQAARCEARNIADPATLTLTKHVINTHGGKAKPADWTLNAVPKLLGPSTISGRSGSPEVTNVQMVPGVGYRLSETNGPRGYRQVDGPSCVDAVTHHPVKVVHDVVTAALGQRIQCEFTNRDIPLPTPTGSSSGPLPITGTSLTPIASLGGFAVVAGLGFLLAARRRRTAADKAE